jgi:hypothetical protein
MQRLEIIKRRRKMLEKKPIIGAENKRGARTPLGRFSRLAEISTGFAYNILSRRAPFPEKRWDVVIKNLGVSSRAEAEAIIGELVAEWEGGK